MVDSKSSSVLHRQLNTQFLRLAGGKGIHLILEDGRQIMDASGGPSVACIGHGDVNVQHAMEAQIAKIAYCATTFCTTDVCETLCEYLVGTTHGHMTRAFIVSSGSEAADGAMKLARQYFLELSSPEPNRTKFIARNQSYHGTTLGALSLGGHAARRAKFEPMLLGNVSKVSPCYAYRHQRPDETDSAYVARLAEELDQEFQRLGPETVCAFVCEPVVGAALGSVPAVEGYLKAVRSVCDKYGALLIFDEVMCGMGRTGTLHAWEHEGVAPDIQTLGKGLGGGYQPVAGVLVNKRVVEVLERGTGAFVHGHTYQGHPIACAAALEVQRVIRDGNLLQNVQNMGALLSNKLIDALSDHPNVGNIRGRGLFWGIEFVADKATKAPFPYANNVAMGIAELGVQKYDISIYPGSGTADGKDGDHMIISPPYNVSKEEIEEVVKRVTALVNDFFKA